MCARIQDRTNKGRIEMPAFDHWRNNNIAVHKYVTIDVLPLDVLLKKYNFYIDESFDDGMLFYIL